MGELAGGGYGAVAVCVWHRWQETGDKRHVKCDMWHVVFDRWHLTYFCCCLFSLFLWVLVLVLVSTHIERFSVSYMRDLLTLWLQTITSSDYWPLISFIQILVSTSLSLWSWLCDCIKSLLIIWENFWFLVNSFLSLKGNLQVIGDTICKRANKKAQFISNHTHSHRHLSTEARLIFFSSTQNKRKSQVITKLLCD